jgi:pimeloyl-ACP methyl ester carboxylesterase
MTRTLSVSGVNLELVEGGAGRPLLFLHAGEGLKPNLPWLQLLARHFHVVAPYHPGFGNSALPDWFATVDDLAYLYLDLAEQLDLKDAILVGASFGGWVAAEMAVRNTNRFARLALADPLGIKTGGITDRDIADLHSLPEEAGLKLSWADPAKGRTDYTKLPETELAAIVRGREALALYGWKPYMHNPRLKHWLHRIDIPTKLIWGAKDGVVGTAYAEAWRSRIPGATLEVLPNAGHYPHWEQPEAFSAALAAFTHA